MKKMRIISLVFIGTLMFLSGCGGGGSQVKQNYPLKTKIEIKGGVFVNPIEDLAAGQMISNEIYDSIISRIKNSGKYSLTEDKNRASYILNIKIMQFTTGNRAARFWVGFGAGAAKFHILCQLIDSNGKIVDEQNFQRFGTESLRSGPALEKQMEDLIIDYTCNWMRL